MIFQSIYASIASLNALYLLPDLGRRKFGINKSLAWLQRDFHF